MTESLREMAAKVVLNWKEKYFISALNMREEKLVDGIETALKQMENINVNEEIFKQLDVECYNCEGTGKASKHFVGGLSLPDCDICYGTGYQVTGAGLELLGFLRRQRKRIEKERV